MSSQAQDKEEITEMKGKGRFYNPFTGRDPFEEDIKKGLSLEEMRRRLQERSAQEKIRYLKLLLSREGGSLKKGTVEGIGRIISESYRFFGDEIMGRGDSEMAAKSYGDAAKSYGKAAKSYENSEQEELAKKAWKLAGDSHMADAHARQPPPETVPSGPLESGPGAIGREDGKLGDTKRAGPMQGRGHAGQGKHKRRTREDASVRASVELSPAEPRKGEKGKGRPSGERRKKSGFALAAAAYENAGESEMAATAWKMAGDEYLSLAEKGDRRYLGDALDSYRKGRRFREAVYVSLLAGKPIRETEDLSKKGNLGKHELVEMANTFLSMRYYHASRFLFALAGEGELAKKVSEIEKENKSKK